MSAVLIPFGKYPMAAVGRDHLFYGSGDRWEVRAYDAAGTLDRIIRLDRAPAPVGDRDLAAYIDDRIAQADDPSEAPAIRDTYTDMPIPEVFPAFAGLATDPLGYLWVERFRVPGDEVPVHDIFDPQGGLVGVVTLPQGVEILEIGEDYLLGLVRDELDVEYVKLFRLGRPGGS